jgi:putative chitinase
MKTLLLLVLLIFGLYPIIENGKLKIAVQATRADSWGDESGEEGGTIDLENIYNSLSAVLDMDIIGEHEFMGHTVFDLGDGSMWDPAISQLDEVEIHGVIQNVMDDFPDIFVPDTPEADPANYENFEEFYDYIEEHTEKPPCPPSVADLEKAFPDASADALELLSSILNGSMETYGIDSETKLQHFLAQAGHETGGFMSLSPGENLNYSAERLLAVWPSRFSTTDPAKANPNDYAHDPEKLANFVYGTINGNNEPGDGYKYRGRGIMQLTGRENYQDFEDYYNSTHDDEIDVAQHPEILETEAELAVESGLWFFKDRVLDRMNVDKNTSVEAVTKKINGNKNGLADRKSKFNSTKENVNCKD